MVAETMNPPEKIVGGGATAAAVVAGKTKGTDSSNDHRRHGSFDRPSWLLFNIADMDERMKMLTSNATEEETAASFAGRAEGYYQKRPQLLALLHDLYNGYVALGDRYCQALAKNQHRRRYSSPISPFHFNENDDEECGETTVDSDVESSLSYQTQFPPVQTRLDPDMLMAELVMKSVNYEIVSSELNIADKRWSDSSRKIELQKSLLEVLESERLILLNENANLGFRMNALLEENKGLASESIYMKRKAAEVARYAFHTRDDQSRVCILSRKIEDLQAQVYGLERRNKEYYDQIVKHEEEKKSKSKAAALFVKSKAKDKEESVKLDDCFNVPGNSLPCFRNGSNSVAPRVKGHQANDGGGGGGDKRAMKLWDRVKKLNIFMCVPNVNSTDC